MTVGDAGDHRAQSQPLRLSGEVAQGGVGLEHVGFGGAHHRDLEVVVHHPGGVEAGVLGRPRNVRQRLPHLNSASGPGKEWDLQSNLHRANLLCLFSLITWPIGASLSQRGANGLGRVSLEVE